MGPCPPAADLQWCLTLDSDAYLIMGTSVKGSITFTQFFVTRLRWVGPSFRRQSGPKGRIGLVTGSPKGEFSPMNHPSSGHTTLP